MTAADSSPPHEPDAERTGLRLLPTWRGVYSAVLVIFVVLLLVMWGFERYYA